MTETDPVPTPEETEAVLARRQGRYAEPKWGVLATDVSKLPGLARPHKAIGLQWIV